MSKQPVTPELRAKIVSEIKSKTRTLPDAAKHHGFAEDTLRKWMRGTKRPVTATGTSELLRLRKEVQQLRAIMGERLLEEELAKRNNRRA